MTTLPSAEAILLEIRESLAANAFDDQTKPKAKFAAGEARLVNHIETGRRVVADIFDALELDDDACSRAARNFQAFVNAYKALELDIWTFDADKRQVLWMLLGHFYIPGLARHIAWWTINCRMDRHMPGGRFWYLPEPRERDGETSLYLPVAQVVDWLLDLLGMPLEKFADQRSSATNGGHDALRRTLYLWRNDTTPEWSTIEKYFKDNVSLQFEGALPYTAKATPEERFAAALAFVGRKKLTARQLRNEIPMIADGRLEAVLEGRASAEERELFEGLLADRYSAPSLGTIRQYLRIARAAQDGYVRLLKTVCPGVDLLCADLSKNKVLQLFALYKFVYNLTIDAWRHHGNDGQSVEDAWFEEQMPPHLACGPLLSISPSGGKGGIFMLSQILKHHFEKAPINAPLEDLWAADEPANLEIMKRNLRRAEAITDEWTAAGELASRLKAGSPWAKLQAETHFNVVAEIVTGADLSERITKAAMTRLHELAQTPAEKVQAIIIELHLNLNDEGRRRTKETKVRVQALLDQSEASPVYEIWKPVILQYKAKHLLAQNDFDGALELFEEARKACKSRSYGRMRGEIARDCLALSLVDHRLTHNHEPYFRDMLRGDIFPTDKVPTIEDAARTTLAYFWDTLYKPYPGIAAQRPRSDEETREIDESLRNFLIRGDRDGFVKWITENKKSLAKPFPDVEGNSVLMSLIKIRNNLAPFVSPLQLELWCEYIGLLIKYGPARQLDWLDLKAQTPLMLMAEEGNAEFVRLLLEAGADPDKQDYRGLSALHAAIKSRVSACVDALLDRPCRTDLLTVDKRSALHTAVWTGNVHATKRLLSDASELAGRQDLYEMTPLKLAKCLLEEAGALEALSAECQKQGNICATKPELEEIATILECVLPSS